MTFLARAMIVALPFFAAGAAHAESAVLEFPIRNVSGTGLKVGFYSQDRDAVWLYDLAAGEARTYELACEVDEKVCFAAWQPQDLKSGWGLGYRGRDDCDRCCYYCGSGSPSPRNLLTPN